MGEERGRKRQGWIVSRGRALWGFTLLEMLVGLALAGVLLGFAALSLPRLASSFSLAAALQQVTGVWHVARVQSVQQSREHRVTFTSGAGSYAFERKQSDGSWIAVEGRKTLPRGISVLSANSGGEFVFYPRGHCENGTVILSDTYGQSRKVILNQRGRVRVE